MRHLKVSAKDIGKGWHMKYQGEVKIISRNDINEEVFSIRVEKPYEMDVKPGQFFNLKTSKFKSPLLRRPISVSDSNETEIEFTIKVVGEGTAQLCDLSVGDGLDIMGPLGNGYLHQNENEILIIGGGIGIAPVKGLALKLKRENPNIHITTVLGFRDEPYDLEAFNSVSDKLFVVSETDENYQIGYVTGPLDKIIKEQKHLIEMSYACGPTPMLKAITNQFNQAKMPIQLLMEEKMACGIGACLVCTCKIKEGDFGYKHERMCKEGPMFFGSEVIFDA